MPVNPTGAAIKTFMRAYRLARKSRLLQSRLGQDAFATAYFAYKRYLEDPFYHLVGRHPELFRGGNVLDIGANIGYTALVFSRVIGEGYKVYAFEPEGFNYVLLKRWLIPARRRDGWSPSYRQWAIRTEPSNCGRTSITTRIIGS